MTNMIEGVIRYASSPNSLSYSLSHPHADLNVRVPFIGTPLATFYHNNITQCSLCNPKLGTPPSQILEVNLLTPRVNLGIVSLLIKFL